MINLSFICQANFITFNLDSLVLWGKSTTSSAALLADDTKCYHAIKGTHAGCTGSPARHGWNQPIMAYDKFKCGVFTVTRKVNPVQ